MMTAANADRCIANTLVYEGGYGINAKDRGDWTSGKIGVGRLAGTAYGIAAMTLTERGLPEHTDMRTITKAQAIELYKRKEWPECRGDALPKGLDQVTYDAVVNSGIGRIDWTGKAVGAANPKSPADVARAAQALPIEQRAAVIKKQIAYRLAFLRALSIAPTFIGGWTKRCVGMEALGVKMVLEDQGLSPGGQIARMEKEAAAAKQKRDGSTAAAGTAGTGGAGGATQVDPSQWDASTWFLATAGTTALLAVIGFFIFQAVKNDERLKAYLAVARGQLGV